MRNSLLKNYKSNLAYLIAVVLFPYTIYMNYSKEIVEITSEVFVILTISMMLRSEQLVEVVKNFSVGFKNV